jgi:hypothetical protein
VNIHCISKVNVDNRRDRFYKLPERGFLLFWSLGFARARVSVVLESGVCQNEGFCCFGVWGLPERGFLLFWSLGFARARVSVVLESRVCQSEVANPRLQNHL